MNLVDTPYLTRKEAADYLRISPRTLDRLGIPCSYAGRRPLFHKSALSAALTTRTIGQPRKPVVGLFDVPKLRRKARARSPQPSSAWLDDIKRELRAN